MRVSFNVKYLLILTMELLMPANTSKYIQDLLNQYPVTLLSLGSSLRKNTGNTNPALYEVPTAENYIKVQEFLDTLVQFENHALAENVDNATTQQLLDKINTLMNDLELTAIRPTESGVDRNWLMFVPIIKDAITPVKIAAVLVYRFGNIIEDSTNNPNATVGNLGLVSEHSIADGTERLTADIFLTCKAKFILANLFQPHTVRNDGTADPSIKYLTDPAHSDTTIFLPMLISLLQVHFRETPVLVIHGMAQKIGDEYQALVGNCNGRFRKDGYKSFANLLGISLGIEDFFTSPENEAANKPSPVVSVCSIIPNSVLKGDQIVPMSSESRDVVNGALRWQGRTINTNVSGHIGYFADSPYYQLIKTGYRCSDRMIHVETTTNIRQTHLEVSANRQQFANVVKRAVNWYRYYDPAIHDPHRLRERFIDRATNMKRYSELFKPWLIARYKKNKADIYNSDTAAYAEHFASNKELPPPLVTSFAPLIFSTVSMVNVPVLSDAVESSITYTP